MLYNDSRRKSLRLEQERSVRPEGKPESASPSDSTPRLRKRFVGCQGDLAHGAVDLNAALPVFHRVFADRVGPSGQDGTATCELSLTMMPESLRTPENVPVLCATFVPKGRARDAVI